MVAATPRRLTLCLLGVVFAALSLLPGCWAKFGAAEVEFWRGFNIEAETPLGDLCLGCLDVQTEEDEADADAADDGEDGEEIEPASEAPDDGADDGGP